MFCRSGQRESFGLDDERRSNAAVARIFGINVWRFPAWVIWLFVHLMSLVGFRNRLLVLINWAYYYFAYERAVRIITA